jgi:hypothetical protein
MIKIYKIIILKVVLCGCETRSLILREEQRLSVFENRVLRRIFGHKKVQVMGGWKILYEKLHCLYSSPNIIRVMKSRTMKWIRHVACKGEMRIVCRILVGKPEGKSPLGRPGHRWEDNIKMDLWKKGFGAWSGFTWLKTMTSGRLL